MSRGRDFECRPIILVVTLVIYNYLNLTGLLTLSVISELQQDA